MIVCLSVHSGVHACAGAGGCILVSNGLWTLFLFLAQRRLWTLQSVPGKGIVSYNLFFSWHILQCLMKSQITFNLCVMISDIFITNYLCTFVSSSICTGAVPSKFPGVGTVCCNGQAIPVLLLCPLGYVLVCHHLRHNGLVASDPSEES